MGYILSLSSAIVYYLSFPLYTHGYLAFFSLIPLFFALSKADSVKKTALTGAIWGITLSILFSVPLFYALVNEYDFTIIFSALLIIISVHIPYAIIYAVYGISFKYFFENQTKYFPLIAASLWVVLDFLMSITPVFTPWGFAGYTQTFNIFIQISDIAGIYGVSFLVVLINSLFNEILIYKENSLKYITIVLLIIFSTSIYGYLRILSVDKEIQSSYKTGIKTALIQGNYSSREKWNSKNTAAILNTYINMTKQVIEEADIIVWPETVLNSNDKNNLEIISGISSLLKKDQIFITGATRNDNGNHVYNSILAADNKGLNYIYDKKILFPFTETSFAGFSSGKFIDSPAIFQRGKYKPVYKTDLTEFGFTICFEAIYPDYVRMIKNSGAAVLVNVANDSWFGNTYEPYMHLYSNIVRAIENRFYVIRSSNSGISAVISPTGKILSSIELNTRNQVITSINPINITTLYSKYGNWIIAVCLLIIILTLTIQLIIKK